MQQANVTRNDNSNIKTLVRKALNSRLAERLSYPHGVDHYLQYLNPNWSIGEVRARVVSVHSQTPDTVTLQLKPNSVWAGFKPGQFVRLTVSINGRLHSRCFSPAQSLHCADGIIELTAKLHAKAFVTRYLRDELKPGDSIGLSQADGEFALPDVRPERVLLISGGSGITPVMSMLRTLADEGHSGAITFLHYANRATDQLYARELAAIAEAHANVTLLRCYVEGNEGELSGLFSAEQLHQAVPDFAKAETFLCGPPGLMGAVEKVYGEMGLGGRLHLERFSAAPVVVSPDESAEGDVHFTRSERYAANNGATLLEQAEAAGLSPAYGCRMGVCYACTCHKTAGKVKDLRTGQVSDAGEGDIQICMSVPVGSVTLDL